MKKPFALGSSSLTTSGISSSVDKFTLVETFRGIARHQAPATDQAYVMPLPFSIFGGRREPVGVQRADDANMEEFAENFEASFKALLSIDGTDYALTWPADTLDQEQKNNLNRLLRHFIPETPEQHPEQPNFFGGDDEVEPVAEGTKIEQPMSNDIEDAVINNRIDSTNSDILKLDDDDVLMIDRDAFTVNIKRNEAAHVIEPEPQQDVDVSVTDQDDPFRLPNTLQASQANNVVNKAILAMNDLVLDDCFKQLANADEYKDKLRDVLKNHLGRSTNKVGKACRLIRLVFVSQLCEAQSTNAPGTKTGTIPLNHDGSLTALGKSFAEAEASSGAKAVIGEEIPMKMQNVKKRKSLVDMAQRLGGFCALFSIGSVFYLVDVLDNDANLLAIKTKGHAMDPGYARLREWNIEDQAQQSGMQKLAEDLLALINQEWKAGKTKAGKSRIEDNDDA